MDAPVKFLCFTIASWIYYLGQQNDETLEPLGFHDPMLSIIQPAAIQGGNSATALLSIKEIFGTDLLEDPRVYGQVDEMVKSFYAVGPKSTLSTYVQQGQRC